MKRRMLLTVRGGVLIGLVASLAWLVGRRRWVPQRMTESRSAVSAVWCCGEGDCDRTGGLGFFGA